MLLVILSSCTFSRIVFFNIPNLNDYKKFPSRELTAGNENFVFTDGTGNTLFASFRYGPDEKMSLDEFLESEETVAFLVIRNDSIIYEHYFDKYDTASIVPSFSMVKSIISILTGCAIDDGLIHSIDDPVTKYIPELQSKGFEKVMLKDLIQMTSGINFNERNLFRLGNLYYGRNLNKIIMNLKPDPEPGKVFRYQNINAQIMGLVLTRVLKGRTLTGYLDEKLWRPLGMEYDATWSIDSRKDGQEKAFCCLNARARDFARIGRLYLDKGNWNGKQIVSEAWVRNSTKLDTANASPPYYQYFWWLPSSRGDFMATGKLGQYIYVYPKENLIIVRLGRKPGDVDWSGFFIDFSKRLKGKQDLLH